MGSTMQCTWTEMKQTGSELYHALPSFDHDQADNAMKCLGLAFWGLKRRNSRGCRSFICSATHPTPT